jgi:hypothetical protein
MSEDKTKISYVGDLGAGAYLLMHGYKVIGKQDKDYLFEITEKEEQDFETLQMEYLRSEFHRFDACIMSLKKIRPYHPR